MKKLSIDLFSSSLGITKENYEKEKKRYIAEFTKYEPTGKSNSWVGRFFSVQTHYGNVHRPDLAEIRWNEMYPNGFGDWINHKADKLTSTGQQKVIDKINEIIDFINAPKKKPKKS